VATGDRLDLPLELRIHFELPPEHAGDELDRPVVMSRAKSSGDDAEIRVEAEPKGALELVRRIADDHDPRRLDAQPDQLGGEKRAVQIAAVAADELAAGDDDDRPGATAQVLGGAFEIAFGVTMNCAALPRPAPGITVRCPFSRATRFCGLAAAIQMRR